MKIIELLESVEDNQQQLILLAALTELAGRIEDTGGSNKIRMDVLLRLLGKMGVHTISAKELMDMKEMDQLPDVIDDVSMHEITFNVGDDTSNHISSDSDDKQDHIVKNMAKKAIKK